MEFGIFVLTHVPKFRRDADPDYEHRSLLNDIEVAIEADKAGFKYIWFSEHHFLDEYSHMSASDVVMGYLAHCTNRIHLGSGIFNPLPQVNHPAKVAEKVAMLDHLTGGRFEFGTGRGAGSHEILGFLDREGITDTTATKAIWEDVIGEFVKMFTQEEYQGYEGKFWSLPPRKILPKPWKKPHPAMWYACGNVTSYQMAARRGLGVLGFSVGAIQELDPVMTAYKKEIPNAEPVGAFVNDNIMVTSAAFLGETEQEAKQAALKPGMTYLQSNVYRYHDTFPHPSAVPQWPELIPDMTPESLDYAIDGGLIVGDPDQAVEQCRRWEAAGADQLVFGTGAPDHEDSIRMIRLMGEHVIPKLDKDPVHRTDRFRDAAS